MAKKDYFKLTTEITFREVEEIQEADSLEEFIERNWTSFYNNIHENVQDYLSKEKNNLAYRVLHNIYDCTSGVRYDFFPTNKYGFAIYPEEEIKRIANTAIFTALDDMTYRIVYPKVPKIMWYLNKFNRLYDEMSASSKPFNVNEFIEACENLNPEIFTIENEGDDFEHPDINLYFKDKDYLFDVTIEYYKCTWE